MESVAPFSHGEISLCFRIKIGYLVQMGFWTITCHKVVWTILGQVDDFQSPKKNMVTVAGFARPCDLNFVPKEKADLVWRFV